MDRDYYYTVAQAYRSTELKVKGSRFIADAYPVSTKQEADLELAKIKKEFYDATHHCYAYRLGINAEHIRAADDGEPAGTGGKPILLALTSKELTNILLVVTRYYGGINLGTGGLSRAYFDAAEMATSGAKIRKIFLTNHFQFTAKYDQVDRIERLLRGYDSDFKILYEKEVVVAGTIRKSLTNKFENDMKEKFYGIVLNISS